MKTTMKWIIKIRAILARVARLVKSRGADRQYPPIDDLDEELKSHIEFRAQANIDAGMTPAEARYAAMRQFGWAESIKEECRDRRGVRWIEHLAQDLRYGARQLRKSPGFASVAVLTLALGIGATTAFTSIVRTALFDPVPSPHPDRLFVLKARDKQRGWTTGGLNPVAARDAEAATNLFRRTVFWEMDSLTLEGGTFPRDLGGARVSQGFFTIFSVPPLLGRLPSVEDSLASAPQVLVLSHELWLDVFGGDPAIVGRTLRFKQASVTVIGVMPRYFVFPGQAGFWRPWPGPDAVAGEVVDTSKGMGPKSLANTGVIVELQPGATEGQARAFLALIQARQVQTDKLQGQFIFIPENLRDSFAKPEVRRTLWGLTAATMLVLLIASANLANLQLARTETRQQELAVRGALGAGRARIFRQLLGESLLLSMLGGAAGLIVTGIGLEILTKLLPPELPRLRAIQLDGQTLALACFVTLATGVLFGVAPAWRGRGLNIGATLKLGSSTATGGRQRAWFARGLIVGQIALVLVLLSGAGLMVRSVRKLLAVDVGFEPRYVVKLYPPLDWEVINHFLGTEAGQKSADSYVLGIYRDLQQRLATLPGVEAVGIVQGRNSISVASVAGGATVDIGLYSLPVEEADPLRAMRARLQLGQWLARGDGQTGRDKVLVNETTAMRFWPGRAAVGNRLWIKEDGKDEALEVAGVIADIRENSYSEVPEPAVYRIAPMGLVGASPSLVIRIGVPYAVLKEAVEREMKASGAGAAQPAVQFVEEGLFLSTAGSRTFMRYLLFFAGAGLLLAAVGLYGVLSYAVSQQMREIGIRLAIGAQREAIIALILRQGLVLALAGAGIGLAVSLAATQSLKAFLFGVPAHDPLTLLGVVGLLACVAFMACWLPARRAARVDPVVSLRQD